jgi:hypothetical protein
MRSRFLHILIAAVLFAGGAFAQTGVWVDPLNGSNGNIGTSASPYKSITYALQQVTGGMTVWLMDGTYTTATGEAFPIELKNLVDLRADGVAVPVIDVNSAIVTAFRVSADITALTRFSGVTVLDCGICLEITNAASIRGFIIEDCDFEQFSDTGLDIALSSGSTQDQLVVDNCSFAGLGGIADAGISILLSNSTELIGGGLYNNDVNGGLGTGIRLTVTGDARSDRSFEIARNTLSGYSSAGVMLEARGGGGNPLYIAEVDCRVDANLFTGTPDDGTVGESGLRLLATRGTIGEGGVIIAEIAFNELDGNDTNILAETVNTNTAQVDIVCDFYGNLIRDATASGVELNATAPHPALQNCDPDFGPGNQPNRAGANTFVGNAVDFRLSLGVGLILARENFWTDGLPTVIGGLIDAGGLLSDVLSGGFTQSVPANTPTSITLFASSVSRFVDYLEDSTRGQITVIADGALVNQDDLYAPIPGQAIVIGLPSMEAGVRQVVVINPGGQVGTFDVQVSASSGGSGPGSPAEEETGCFVATAAHGDYESAEVRELRSFRDNYLQTTPAGRSFIRWYYGEGPVAAAWIAERPLARSGARAALQAPVWVASALNSWNPGQRSLAGVLLLGLVFGLRRRR